MQHIGPTSLNHRLFSLLVTIGVGLALAACGAEPAPQAPTSEVQLDALVAEAVETQRAGTAVAEGRAATLTEAAAQPAALLQAQTSTPTITPTPEISPTPYPTLQVGNTATVAPPAAPTRQPGDPALRLGDPDWQDTFEDGANWGEYADTRAKIEVRSGALQFTAFEIGAGPIWTLSWPDARNFYLEVEALSPSSCAGQDRYGLVFRSPDPSEGYRVEISCDGQYRMVTFDESGSQVIVAWASSESLNAGPNQINRIGIWAEETTLGLYVNGAAVAGLNHEAYPRGRFGVFVTAEETANFTVSFDNLLLWTFE